MLEQEVPRASQARYDAWRSSGWIRIASGRGVAAEGEESQSADD